MPARWLNARAVVTILLTGIIGALLGVGVGVYIANMSQPWYRAEMQLAMLRRQRYGQSSERLDSDIAQLEMRLEDCEEDVGEQIAARPEPDHRMTRARPRFLWAGLIGLTTGPSRVRELAHGAGDAIRRTSTSRDDLPRLRSSFRRSCSADASGEAARRFRPRPRSSETPPCGRSRPPPGHQRLARAPVNANDPTWTHWGEQET